MPTNKPMQVQWREIDGRLVPFTLPQHWNGNDWAITGTDNPLPVANYTKKGNLWLPTSEDNPVPTQVTGRNVEQLKPVDGLALTSTSSQTFTVDISKYKKIYLIARSTCDADVLLHFRPLTNSLQNFWDGENWVSDDDITIKSNQAGYVHVNSKLNWLHDIVIRSNNGLVIRVAASSAPTEGSVTVWVMGVPN